MKPLRVSDWPRWNCGLTVQRLAVASGAFALALGFAAASGPSYGQAGDRAPTGAATLELFGVPLKDAPREKLRAALLKGGLKPKRVDTKYWSDIYVAKGVLDGADTLEVYYVGKTETFAAAVYTFPGFMDTQFVTRVINLVKHKYGPPESLDGSASLGPVTALWPMPDGMAIAVTRRWPDTTTMLQFLDTKAFPAMQAEQAAEREHRERKRAKDQSKAF